MSNRLTTWSSGDILTAAALNAEVDNLATGTLSRTAGYFGTNDLFPLYLGSSQDTLLQYDTVQTQDCFMIGLNMSDGGYILVVDKADIATNLALSQRTDPALIIHSADATTAAQYIELQHNQTNAVVNAGAGGIALQIAGSTKALLAAGILYLGDTSNAGMTVGLTLNQGAADNEIISLKSSDVSHGFTSFCEADTYASFVKASSTDGGVSIRGFVDTGTQAVEIRGLAESDDTNHDATGVAPVTIVSSKRSGTGATAVGANGNIFAVSNNGTTKVIFDAEGDAFNDGTGWTAYDSHDDHDLLEALDQSLDKGMRDKRDGKDVAADHQKLIDAKILAVKAPGQDPFVCHTRLSMLQTGTLRDLNKRVAAIEKSLNGK